MRSAARTSCGCSISYSIVVGMFVLSWQPGISFPVRRQPDRIDLDRCADGLRG